MPYGDQALFMGTEAFRSVGGYPDMPLMEDVALVRKLRGRGRIRMASSAVTTSARRWRHMGVLRTTLENWAAVTVYGLGMSPERLARWYHRPRGREGNAA